MTTPVDPAPPAPPPSTKRRRWPRLLGIVALAVLLLVGAFVVRLLWRAGAFRRIEPHFAGTCRLIEGPVGAEDITIDQRTGMAYISGSDRRAALAGNPVPGAIWGYALDQPDARPVNLTPEAGIEFQPHGISLWPEDGGGATLFIINHPPPDSGWPEHTVEIVDVRDGRLQHRATLTDPRLIMPNDLVAVGIDRFYLTNTHAHGPGVLQTIETYLQLRSGNVLAYGPGGFHVAAEHLMFPNGITASADGRTIYVATVTQGDVLVFDRDPDTGALALRDAIAIDSGGDNIERDADGMLWIGAHPKLLAVARHAEDPSALAPAQVLRVDPATKRVEEVYLSDGTPLPAASVGARYRDRLLIGQIFDEGFLDCRLPE